jgi:hypothetical protein
MNRLPIAELLLAIAAVLPATGCSSSPAEPQPAPPSRFDRAFDAALGAATEIGVEVQSADRAGGRIAGSIAGVEVTIAVQRQANGSVRVEFSAADAPADQPRLSDRWRAAYDRRMGR